MLLGNGDRGEGNSSRSGCEEENDEVGCVHYEGMLGLAYALSF